MPEENQPAGLTRETAVRLIELPLLSAELTEPQVREGCVKARAAGIAGVIVRPCDADIALRELSGSGVVVCAPVNAPHGLSTTAAKLYEGRDLLRRGVQNLEFYLNTARMISRHFQAMETELLQIAESCAEKGATLKIVFDPKVLAFDLRLVALKLCKRVGADFAVLSCDPGFEEIRTLKQHSGERLQLKAGLASTWEEFNEFHQSGCSRINVTDIASTLEGAPVIVS